MTIVPQKHTNVWFNKTNSTPKLIYLHKNYANLHLFHSKLLFLLKGYSRPDLLKWHWLFAYRWRNYSPFFHKMTTYEIYITTTRILSIGRQFHHQLTQVYCQSFIFFLNCHELLFLCQIQICIQLQSVITQLRQFSFLFLKLCNHDEWSPNNPCLGIWTIVHSNFKK